MGEGHTGAPGLPSLHPALALHGGQGGRGPFLELSTACHSSNAHSSRCCPPTPHPALQGHISPLRVQSLPLSSRAGAGQTQQAKGPGPATGLLVPLQELEGAEKKGAQLPLLLPRFPHLPNKHTKQ